MFNRSSRTGVSLGLNREVSTRRKVLVIVLALLIAATLVFAIIGLTLDGADSVAAGDSQTVVAGWSFGGEDLYRGGGAYGSFRAGPSWS